MKKFTYKAKDSCVCAQPLDQKNRRIKKQTDWGTFSFVQCRNCKTWVQSPQIKKESLQLWYDSIEYQAAGVSKAKKGVYLDYMADESQRRVEAEERYKRDLTSILSPGSRILEVGSATGSLLAVMRQEGHHVVGIDLSVKFARQAKLLYGLDTVLGDFLELENQPEYFDLIVMLGTISNLQNLPSHLSYTNELLKTGGFFYFNLPLSDSVIARLYGRHFWMFTPSVSTFFSRKGIYMALRKAGFEIVKYKTDYQKPSFSKLLGQSKLMVFYSLARQLGIEKLALPFSLPIPGIVVIWAKKECVEKTIR